MVDINQAMSLITLNINGLNIPIHDRNCQSGLKSRPTVCFYKKPTLNIKTCILEVPGWRKICYGNTNQKKARVVILISESRYQSSESYQG